MYFVPYLTHILGKKETADILFLTKQNKDTKTNSTKGID